MIRNLNSLVVILSVFLASLSASARSWRVAQIPNGQSLSCLNCHLSRTGGSVNKFGNEVSGIVRSGSSDAFWSAALASKDSDGDGYTNGEELGDTNGDGIIDSNITEVTNPGDSASFPSLKKITVEISAADTVGSSVANGDKTHDHSLILTFNISDFTENFDSSDLILKNGKITKFLGSGKLYTAIFTPSAIGNSSVKVPAKAFTDVGNNGNDVDDEFTWNYLGNEYLTIQDGWWAGDYEVFRSRDGHAVHIETNISQEFSYRKIDDFLRSLDISYSIMSDFFPWPMWATENGKNHYIRPKLGGAGTGEGGTGWGTSYFGVRKDGGYGWTDDQQSVVNWWGTLIHENIHLWDSGAPYYFQGPDTAHAITWIFETYLMAKHGANYVNRWPIPTEHVFARGYNISLNRYLNDPILTWEDYFGAEAMKDLWLEYEPYNSNEGYLPMHTERLTIQGGLFFSIINMHGEKGLMKFFDEVNKYKIANSEATNGGSLLSSEEKNLNFIKFLGDGLQLDVSDYFKYWKYPVPQEAIDYLSKYPKSSKILDSDGDGYSPLKGDFNDQDKTVYPGAPEFADQIDNNQDGLIDENVFSESVDYSDDINDAEEIQLPALIKGEINSLKDVDCLSFTLDEKRNISFYFRAVNTSIKVYPTENNYDDKKYGTAIFSGKVHLKSDHWDYVEVENGIWYYHNGHFQNDLVLPAGTYTIQLDTDSNLRNVGDYEIQIFENSYVPQPVEHAGLKHDFRIYHGLEPDLDFDCEGCEGVSKEECEALVQIYNNLGGLDYDIYSTSAWSDADGWWDSPGWLTTKDIDYWRGVNTDRKGISTLNFHTIFGRPLIGDLSLVEWDKLKNLRHLDMSVHGSYGFNGEIPESLINLKLDTFYFNGHKMTIPNEKTLKWLYSIKDVQPDPSEVPLSESYEGKKPILIPKIDNVLVVSGEVPDPVVIRLRQGVNIESDAVKIEVKSSRPSVIDPELVTVTRKSNTITLNLPKSESGHSDVSLVVTDSLGISSSAKFNVRFLSPSLIAADGVKWPKISASSGFSAAIRSDGTLEIWGSPDKHKGYIYPPQNLKGLVGLFSGSYYTYAITDQGGVVYWGEGAYGQNRIPEGLKDLVSMSLGHFYTIALDSQGKVFAWGWGYGERHYDDAGLETPGQLPDGLTNIKAIASGLYHNLALKTDGTVMAWGKNEYGQTDIPEDLSDVIGIACGDYHSLAIKRDGTVVGWGLNDDGQCDPPDELNDVLALSAGNRHSLALIKDGSLITWGTTAMGLGQIPVEAKDIAFIESGANHNLALSKSGKLFAWGENGHNKATVPSSFYKSGNTGVDGGGSGEQKRPKWTPKIDTRLIVTNDEKVGYLVGVSITHSAGHDVTDWGEPSVSNDGDEIVVEIKAFGPIPGKPYTKPLITTKHSYDITRLMANATGSVPSVFTMKAWSEVIASRELQLSEKPRPKWVPEIKIPIEIIPGTGKIVAKILIGHGAGHAITDWGRPVIEGDVISVDLETYGPVPGMVYPTILLEDTQEYDLTKLIKRSSEHDSYLFKLTAWGNELESKEFNLKGSVEKVLAKVALGELKQTYDGKEKKVNVTTDPAGLSVEVIYTDLDDGSAVASPTEIGAYRVVATVTDENYHGSTSVTLSIVAASAGGEPFGEPVTYTNIATTMIGQVTINGTAAREGDVVAVYVGEELRGKQGVIVDAGTAWVNAQVHAAGGVETAVIRVYEASTGITHDKVGLSVEIKPEGEAGAFAKPLLIRMDNVTPELTLLGEDQVAIDQRTTYVDAGASATDNVDGDLTSKIIVSGVVDTSSAGIYTLKYDVSDAAGNTAESVSRTVVVEKTTVVQTLDLKEGWNLISFYVESEDMTPATVLASIKGNLVQIKDLKSSYNPTLPAFINTLKGLNVKDGYWLKVDEATSFELEGMVSEGVSIPVNPGWNLLGYPRDNGAAPADELKSLGDAVVQFKNLKDSYNPALPAFINTLKVITPGLGYWLKVSEKGVWNVGDVSSDGANRGIVKLGPDDKGPGWGQVVVYPNVGATVLAEVFIIGEAVTDGSVVGAFMGDELRGEHEVVLADGRSYVAINVNLQEAEKVSFRIWDAGSDSEYGVAKTMTLKMGEMYGTATEFVKLDGAVPDSGSTIRIVGYDREPFGFGFESQIGQRYEVEATGDLKEWGVIKTYNGTGTLIRFKDERDQVFPQIYYRVRVSE